MVQTNLPRTPIKNSGNSAITLAGSVFDNPTLVRKLEGLNSSRSGPAIFLPGQPSGTVQSLSQLIMNEPCTLFLKQVNGSIPAFNLPPNVVTAPFTDLPAGVDPTDAVLLRESGPSAGFTGDTVVPATTSNLTVPALVESAPNSGSFTMRRVTVAGSTGLAPIGPNNVPVGAIPNDSSLFAALSTADSATKVIVAQAGQLRTATVGQILALIPSGPPVTGGWLDTFTDADGTLLSAHTGENTPGGYTGSTVGGFAITNNKAVSTTTDPAAVFTIPSAIANGYFSVDMVIEAITNGTRTVACQVRGATGSGLVFLIQYTDTLCDLFIRNDANQQNIFSAFNIRPQVPDGLSRNLIFRVNFTGSNYQIVVNGTPIPALDFSFPGIEDNRQFFFYSGVAGNAFDNLTVAAV